MKYQHILEEAVKNKVSQDFFSKFDCTNILGKIDFAVKIKCSANVIDYADEYLLWAESKKERDDVISMLTQLVLTIGKARIFEDVLPPPFLGCFDCEKIAFVPYSEVQEIFYLNDFNWKVAPSDKKTREFKQVAAKIEKVLSAIPWETYVFDFEKDDNELKRFIRDNFVVGKTETSKIKIDKNNFINIYVKWLEAVKPTIQVDNWALARQNGIIDGDFYLADLISDENKTLKEKLAVLLKSDVYELNLNVPYISETLFTRRGFSDNQKAYEQFWAKYKRPPDEEYRDYIIKRRDLLVPQDVRERKGSFFTPKIWVELSQKYLADVFGKDWQDEYYIWDCAAGTGNLLAGLTNKYNIWASTLDKTDVDVMKDRITNGANLLESHVFQFDFLNDDFSKLPQGLQEIINDPKLRKKLIIYINPPYAEAGTGLGKNHKEGVALGNKIHIKYAEKLGKARNELFAQFLIRIYFEIHGCKIGEFSTQKALIAPNFKHYRNSFLAKFKKGFIVPADTFDNVKGKFPIGFKVWDTDGGQHLKTAVVDVYDASGEYSAKKIYYDGSECKYINDWFRQNHDRKNTPIGILHNNKNDFQHNNQVRISSDDIKDNTTPITRHNLIAASIYFTVRKCIDPTWLNDRDQFLYPNNKWKNDVEFQNDCLAYTLFNNNIQSKYGVNHWIPFMEHEINAREKFDSHFMISFISGKLIQNRYSGLFEQEEKGFIKREFSPEAKKVFDAGRELWKYYHAQPKCNVNASFYDIREHFQGRNDKGKMNAKSNDEKYNELIGDLRSELKTLAAKIEPKVYEYGFLRE